MYQILRVTWQVAPLRPPLIRRHCSCCAAERPFACSMKFRTNIQKKRIDVWLIYRCSSCDEVWNLPIFERVGIGDLPPDAFDAIARNDAALALHSAFDRRLLQRHGVHAEDCPEAAVEWQVVSGQPETARTAEFSIQLVKPWRARLDRFLARQLGLERAGLASLHEAGELTILPPCRNALRHAVVDGQRIGIKLAQDSVGARLLETIRTRIGSGPG